MNDSMFVDYKIPNDDAMYSKGYTDCMKQIRDLGAYQMGYKDATTNYNKTNYEMKLNNEAKIKVIKNTIKAIKWFEDMDNLSSSNVLNIFPELDEYYNKNTIYDGPSMINFLIDVRTMELDEIIKRIDYYVSLNLMDEEGSY